jgi:hypothetical protein
VEGTFRRARRGRVPCVAFSPDSLRLLTAVGHWPGDPPGPAGQVRIWDLPKTDRPVADLISEAELLCGSRIDHTCALVPLAPDELLERWRAMVKTVAQRNPHGDAYRHSDFVIPLAFVIRVWSFGCGCAGRRTVFKAPLFRLISRVTGSAARRFGNNHLQSGGGFVTCGT